MNFLAPIRTDISDGKFNNSAESRVYTFKREKARRKGQREKERVRNEI